MHFSYEYVSDGKGGKKLVKKDKKGKKEKDDKKGKKNEQFPKEDGYHTDFRFHAEDVGCFIWYIYIYIYIYMFAYFQIRFFFFSGSLASTDPEDEPDLSKMTNEEREAYFKAKAQRKLEREKKRKEKYGDKYEEMMKKHKE